MFQDRSINKVVWKPIQQIVHHGPVGIETKNTIVDTSSLLTSPFTYLYTTHMEGTPALPYLINCIVYKLFSKTWITVWLSDFVFETWIAVTKQSTHFVITFIYKLVWLFCKTKYKQLFLNMPRTTCCTNNLRQLTIENDWTSNKYYLNSIFPILTDILWWQAISIPCDSLYLTWSDSQQDY